MIDLIIGRRRLGKSTLALHLARELMAPCITVDPRAQFAIGHAVPMIAVDPDEALFALEEDRDIIVQPRFRQAAIDALAWPAEEFIVNDDHSRRLTVLFDEAGLYDVQSWDYLMRCSPVDRTRFIFTAHRPKDISVDLRAIADTWYIFRTVQDRDLDAIEERCGLEVREHVQTLEPFQYVKWDDARARASINRSPAAWYTPLDLAAV